MARDWFGRKTNTGDLSGIEGYYDQPGGWRLWMRRIIGVLVILLLLAVFAWAAMWVYQSVTDDSADSSSESGQVDSPGDNAIDDGGVGSGTEGESSSTDGGTDSSGTSSEGSSDSSSTNDSSTSGDSDSTNSDGSTADESMPQTGDDSGDTPADSTEVLPATGG